MSRTEATLLVGLGSPHGDDAVGWRIADAIAAATLPTVMARRAVTPLDLLDWLDGVDQLLMCDACLSTDEVGTVYSWRWPELPIERRPGIGSHAVGLLDALRFAEQLGRLPEEVRIYSIAGRQFEPEKTICASLEAALPAIVDRVMGDLMDARALAGNSIA